MNYNKGDIFTVTGWGTTQSGDLADKLQTVDVPHVPDDECNENYIEYGGIVKDNMICAGAPNLDSCQVRA